MDKPLPISTYHEIFIGKGREYLVFKLTSQRYLYQMATCQFDEFFDEENFICTKCRPAHHSFGLQNQKCYPCNSLWMSSKNDDLLYAIYLQKCTDGQYKSIFLIVGTIVIILIVGITCCCTNRVLERKLRIIQKKQSQIQQTAEEAIFRQKLGAAIGFRYQLEQKKLNKGKSANTTIRSLSRKATDSSVSKVS